MSFKDKYTLEDRKNESERILIKFTDRIPLIISKNNKCKKINDMNKNKFLIPKLITVGQLTYVIRKKINLLPEKAIFVFFNKNTLVPSYYTLEKVYEEFKDDDGFLYAYYSDENSYG